MLQSTSRPNHAADMYHLLRAVSVTISKSMSVRTMHSMLSELEHPLDVLGLGKPNEILERLSTPLLLVKGQALCC